MTTIVWRDGVLAADSQVTQQLSEHGGGFRNGSVQKIHRHRGFLYGCCGDLLMMERFRDWFHAGLKEFCPLDECSEAMIVCPDGRVLVYNGVLPHRIDGPYYAIGSGRQFALGALALGASAVEAVEAAAVHDAYTGLPVSTLTQVPA